MKFTLNPYQNYLEIKSQIYLKKFEKCKYEQEKLLKEILKLNKTSTYGKKYNFKKIKDYNMFQSQVPISNFEQIEKYINDEKNKKNSNSILSEVVDYFAITSGTTNTPKFLPHTKNYVKKRQIAWEIWNHSIYNEKPKTYSLTGSILTFTSKPFDDYTKSKIQYGSVSGKIHDLQLPLIKLLFALPDEISQVNNFKTKHYLNALFSIRENVTLIATPNPSTILLFVKTIKENINQIISDLENNTIDIFTDEETIILNHQNTKNIPKELKMKILEIFSSNKSLNYKTAQKLKLLKKENKLDTKYIFENLQTIGCWTKGHVNIYLKELKKHFDKSVMIRDLGYMASEGRFTIPIETKENGEGILDIQANFYEFIKVKEYDLQKPTIYLAHKIELNEKYYMYISNENGLYRYDLNDIIEVTGFYKNTKTPMITFVQKGKYFSSITGEKISEWEINETISKLQTSKKIHIKTYFVVPNISMKNPNYNYYLEFDKIPSKTQIKDYEVYLESELQKENIEYKEKRESKRLNPIKIHILPKNSVEKIKKEFSKGKSKDIQIKEPKLIVLDKDKKLIKEFLKNNTIK
ncbi:MAG: GH3 auxin-responsive promoter family protein [Nanoarchaeales archaeon]|nr:GH3 auxin-responsive promoter family protein [Nanoarchaeales archaeon]